MATTISTGQAAQLGANLGFAGMGVIGALSNAGVLNVDDHPANNISHMPVDSPPDGTNLGVNAAGSGYSPLSKSTPNARLG